MPSVRLSVSVWTRFSSAIHRIDDEFSTPLKRRSPSFHRHLKFYGELLKFAPKTCHSSLHSNSGVCRIELKLGTEFNHDGTLLFFIYFRTPHCDISANVHSPPRDTYTVLFCVSYPCLTIDMTRFSNKIISLLKLRIGRDGLLFRNFTSSCHCHRVGLSSDIVIVRKHHRWFNSLPAYFLLTVIYIWYNCKLFVLLWNACEWLNKNSSNESTMKYHYNQWKGDRE